MLTLTMRLFPMKPESHESSKHLPSRLDKVLTDTLRLAWYLLVQRKYLV